MNELKEKLNEILKPEKPKGVKLQEAGFYIPGGVYQDSSGNSYIFAQVDGSMFNMIELSGGNRRTNSYRGVWVDSYVYCEKVQDVKFLQERIIL